MICPFYKNWFMNSSHNNGDPCYCKMLVRFQTVNNISNSNPPAKNQIIFRNKKKCNVMAESDKPCYAYAIYFYLEFPLVFHYLSFMPISSNLSCLWKRWQQPLANPLWSLQAFSGLLTSNFSVHSFRSHISQSISSSFSTIFFFFRRMIFISSIRSFITLFFFTLLHTRFYVQSTYQFW